MPVVPLTVTISLCLVFTFVVFFLREHARGSVSSAERDSLLPFADEGTQLARVRVAAPAASLRPADDARADLNTGGRSSPRV
ncbi:MAG TPA: hypothetical protein VEQ65_05775 [Opitutus sp.]|nr:hypothetical protein [Opitutus sp.]